MAQKYAENAKAHKEKRIVPDKGIHYPFPYMRILKERGKTKRLKFFVERMSVLQGYLKGFKPVYQQGAMGFQLKKGSTPSQALDQAILGPSLLGCAEVCWLSQWQGLRKVLGDPKFDFLFASDSPTPLFIGSQLKNPLTRIMQKEEFPKLENIRPGDMVNFGNVEAYRRYHPFGDGTTYNAIALRPTLFTTLGLPAKGASLAEIESELLDSFNEAAIPMDATLLPDDSAERIGRPFLAQPDSSKPTLSKREFKEMKGGKLGLIFRLDPKKVQYLVEASNAFCRKSLDSWTGELV